VGLPLLLLLAAEGALRVLGYGENRAYIVKDEIQGREVYRDNPDFFGLFFPPALRPAQLPFVVERKKPPGEIRVVLLGGSAAMGIPDAAYGMAPMLEEMLRRRHPGSHIRVLNLANTAINSFVVQEIAHQAMVLDPDVVVVYLGNNEVVGPYGAGTVFTGITPSRSIIRASIALRKTRVGQLLRSLMSGGRSSKGPSEWKGMEMFVHQEVTADDPNLERVYSNFRANLEDICQTAHSHGVPVVLSTVGTNRRNCAPFASTSLDAVDSTLTQAEDQRNAGDFAAARSLVETALSQAPDCADAHYRLGRLSLALGDTARGRQELDAARDLDILRFRADSKIEKVIDDVAAESATQQVRYVDAADTLDAASPFGVSGWEYFLEHVHLDWFGNYRVARAFLPAVEAGLAEQAPSGYDPQPSASPEQISSSALAQSLAYTLWTRTQLIGQILTMQKRPPFTAQSDHQEQLGRLQAQLERATATMEEKTPEDYWPVYEQSMRSHPEEWIREFQAARFLSAAMGDVDGAAKLWMDITRRVPHFAPAWNKLAQGALAQGRKNDARTYLERSLEINPNQPDMLWNLANLLAQIHDFDAARNAVNALLRLVPDHAAAQKLRRNLEAP
jgi:tetratricopeptide (TPR) repeat protein